VVLPIPDAKLKSIVRNSCYGVAEEQTKLYLDHPQQQDGPQTDENTSSSADWRCSEAINMCPIGYFQPAPSKAEFLQ
jgi:hypothetical protein